MMIIDTLLTIFFGVFGLGIIVFVHELGHFLAAKLCKIEVETFSLGWGKKLVGFKYKGTNYQISRIPIGGYCKMKGEYLKEQLDDEAEEKLRKEKHTFMGASPWKRAFVALAGPLSNLIFAAFIFSIINIIGFNITSPGNKIILLSDYPDLFTAEDYSESPATIFGLKTGDRIISIDDKETESFWHIGEIISNNPDKELTFNIIRHGLEMSFIIIPANLNGKGKIGISTWIEPIIGTLEPASFASLAGLQPEDRILAVNGQEIDHSIALNQILWSMENLKEIIFTVQRNNEILEKSLPLEYNSNGIPILGFSFAEVTYKSFHLNFFESIQKAVQETIITTQSFIYGLIELFSFKAKNVEDTVAGPVRIITLVGENTTKSFKTGIGEGFHFFFKIISIISIIIALTNLLPIPALDGGTIVISIFEQVRRKPLKLKSIFRFQVIGFSFIALLIVVALFSDIMYIIKNIFS